MWGFFETEELRSVDSADSRSVKSSRSLKTRPNRVLRRKEEVEGSQAVNAQEKKLGPPLPGGSRLLRFKDRQMFSSKSQPKMEVFKAVP